MADSSDCTHVVKQNLTFKGTVLGDDINASTTRLVQIHNITPHRSDAGELTVEDIIVLGDDGVIILVYNSRDYGKLLQLFPREYDFLAQIDIPTGVGVGCIVACSVNLLAFIDSPVKTIRILNFLSRVRLELCSVMDMALHLTWNGKDLTVPYISEHPFPIDILSGLVFSGVICGIVCGSFVTGGGYGYKRHVLLFDKDGRCVKTVLLQPLQHESYGSKYFLSLDEQNSRFYHLTHPRQMQCYSYFGVIIWQLRDMAEGLQKENVILGMTKNNNKLCCCFRNRGIITIDTNSKITRAVEIENLNTNRRYCENGGITLQL